MSPLPAHYDSGPRMLAAEQASQHLSENYSLLDHKKITVELLQSRGMIFKSYQNQDNQYKS